MRSHLQLTLAFVAVLIISLLGTAAPAQFPTAPVDDGQQYWRNYWRWHNQRYAPAYQQQAASTYASLGHYYPTTHSPQKPFTGLQPAPTAYERYWPLMVYPDMTFGYWY